MRKAVLCLFFYAVSAVVGCGTDASSWEDSASRSHALTGIDLGATDCSGRRPKLALSFLGGGQGVIDIQPGGLSCDSTSVGGCSPEFCPGEELQLTARPAIGSASTFVTWAGACAASGLSSCRLKMDTDTIVQAVFSPPFCEPNSARDCQYCYGQHPLDTVRPYAGVRRCLLSGSAWGDCEPMRRTLGPYLATDPIWNHIGTCGYQRGSYWRVPAGTRGAPCPMQLGPYRSLPKGDYMVQFSGQAFGDATIHIDVRDDSNNRVIGSSPTLTLPRGSFWQSIPFSNSSDCYRLEFRIWWYGPSTVELHDTTLIPLR